MNANWSKSDSNESRLTEIIEKESIPSPNWFLTKPDWAGFAWDKSKWTAIGVIDLY